MVEPSHTPCPEPARLRALRDERLGAAERQVVAAHLSGCSWCRGTLDVLAAEDAGPADTPPPTVAFDPAEPPGSSQLTAVYDPESGPLTLADRPPGYGPDAEHPAGLAFLSPTDQPERLARFGPYEVLEVLGRGGMGVVLKAFDPALHRVVAIKVLAPQLAAGATARKRFVREGRAAASVAHEHVVTIHTVDEFAGFPYLVMQYVDGTSLQERVEREGPLPVAEILRIGMQTAAGLAAAHAQGIVHRDIKPGNILLENGVERVKLTDFGLARAIDDPSLTQAGVVAGTPEYMAPEQARGEAVDARADLFSLGAVLYTMATGRSPFRAPNTPAVLRKVCDEAPRPIRELNPAIPGWLDAIIGRLLAKHPGDRYSSAEVVARLLGDRLAALQRGEAIGTEPLVTHDFGFDPGPVPQETTASVGPTLADLVGPAKSPYPYPQALSHAPMRGAVLLGLPLALLLVVFSFTSITRREEQTASLSQGRLVIQVEDPQVEAIELLRDGRIEPIGPGVTTLQVPAGEQRIRIVRQGRPGAPQPINVPPEGECQLTIPAAAAAQPPLVVLAPADGPGHRTEVVVVGPDRTRLDGLKQLQDRYRARRLVLEDVARQLGFQLGVARREAESRDRDLKRLQGQADAGTIAPADLEPARAALGTSQAQVQELSGQLDAVQGRIQMLGDAAAAFEAEAARLRARLAGSEDAPLAREVERKLSAARRNLSQHAQAVALADVARAQGRVERTASALRRCEQERTRRDPTDGEPDHDQAAQAVAQARQAHEAATQTLALAQSRLARIEGELTRSAATREVAQPVPAQGTDQEPLSRFEQQFARQLEALGPDLPPGFEGKFRALGEALQGLGEGLPPGGTAGAASLPPRPPAPPAGAVPRIEAGVPTAPRAPEAPDAEVGPHAWYRPLTLLER